MLECKERSNGSKRVRRVFEGESKTEQNHQNETDINKIVSRYQRTGQMPTNLRLPYFGDFTGVTSYHEAVDRVREMETEFMKLPAALRKRFRNDPAELVDFLNDAENRSEAMKLGLVEYPSPIPEVPAEPPTEPDTEPE